MKEYETIDYGDEEGDLYYHRVRRTRPFERVKHYHSTYEVYYLLSGRRTYFIKDRSYRVAAGDLVLIDKYDVHKASVLGDPEHERIVINFSDAFVGSIHPLQPEQLLRLFRRDANVIRLSAHDQLFVVQLLAKMGNELKERAFGYETYARLLLVELLLFASRLAERQENAAAAPAGPVHAKIAEIVQYINGHSQEKLTLSSLAASFYMNPSYLSRTFKAVTGFTLTGYVNFTRIKEAQRLLQDTDAKIVDIAAAVGFDHIGHFERTFKTIVATTPHAYRKMHTREQANIHPNDIDWDSMSSNTSSAGRRRIRRE